MLFLTVYGPELESVFSYIRKYTILKEGVSRDQIFSAFVPHAPPLSRSHTKNIEDALAYLESMHLIKNDAGWYYIAQPDVRLTISFSVRVLRQFYFLAQDPSQISAIDYFYITLLKKLYISVDQVWISDVHKAVNQLDVAKQLGGISQEKIGAWKRVMEFLGLGYRASSGFYCLIRPEVLLELVKQWPLGEGTLQDFLEKYLELWLPSLSMHGEIAQSIARPLEYLESQGYITLDTLQDSPSRPYLGSRYVRGIKTR